MSRASNHEDIGDLAADRGAAAAVAVSGSRVQVRPPSSSTTRASASIGPTRARWPAIEPGLASSSGSRSTPAIKATRRLARRRGGRDDGHCAGGPLVIVQPPQAGAEARAAQAGSKPGEAPFTGMSFKPLFENDQRHRDPRAHGRRRARRLSHARLRHDRRPPVGRRDRRHRGRQDRRESLEARRRRVRIARIQPLRAQRRTPGRRGARRAQARELARATSAACAAFSASASASPSSSAARSASAFCARPAWSPASSSPAGILARLDRRRPLHAARRRRALPSSARCCPRPAATTSTRAARSATAVGFAVGWTDWLTYCAVLGYVSIGMASSSACSCRRSPDR